MGNPVWGGRFSAPPSEALRRFNDSLAFDRELLLEDLEGSLAWAEALRGAGVLSTAEARELRKALSAIQGEALAGSLPALEGSEDVHSWVEAELFRRAGAVAGKLHTGRSRNDQVAVDFRLWLRRGVADSRSGALALAAVLAARAEEEAGTAMPGYTHLKRAEPVTFGHWLLAYVEMLLRDVARAEAALARGDECPLGSGALSGTPVPVDREALARSLGFARATANSLDAVSDRDLAADYLYGAALLLSHLSRMAEDLIFFTSDECGFASLPDALSTGSSRMPQKRNPDVPELVRAHAGRAIGELTGLLAILKGLPLAYDKDLQLDKEPCFRVRAALAAALPALTGLVSGLLLHRERMREAASDDRLLATAVADAMARRGVPFREAHEAVGRRIAEAERSRSTLLGLGPGGEITAEDLRALDLDAVLRRRDALGGTAPRRVKAAARRAKSRIDRLSRKKK